MEPLEIEIKPSDEKTIEQVQITISPEDFAKHHLSRHRVQLSNKGIYLIAWHNDEPVGHILLRWDGPVMDTSNRYPYPTPYLEAVGTVEKYRRRGIATALIHRATELSKAKGGKRIGLAVGSTDNPHAKSLYEKLGFCDWGQGIFEVSWVYQTKDGRVGREAEMCSYLFKELS